MRLPPVQKSQCECDIYLSLFLWFFAMKLEFVLWALYIYKLRGGNAPQKRNKREDECSRLSLDVPFKFLSHSILSLYRLSIPAAPPQSLYHRVTKINSRRYRLCLLLLPISMLAETNGSPYAGGDAPKLRTACENCRQSKVKCNLSGKNVCTRCLRHGLQCQYGFANRSGKPKGSKNRATLRKLGQLQEDKPPLRGFRGSRLVPPSPMPDRDPMTSRGIPISDY